MKKNTKNKKEFKQVKDQLAVAKVLVLSKIKAKIIVGTLTLPIWEEELRVKQNQSRPFAEIKLVENRVNHKKQEIKDAEVELVKTMSLLQLSPREQNQVKNEIQDNIRKCQQPFKGAL